MIAVEIDTSGLQELSRELRDKVLPDVAARAFNRTAEEAQLGLRQQLGQSFTLRTPQSAQFFSRMIRIAKEDRATPQKLEAVVRITGPQDKQGRNRASLITRHILGGTRTLLAHALPRGVAGAAVTGGQFFIPAEGLRTTKGAVVPKSFYPGKLGDAIARAASPQHHARRGRGTGGKRGVFVVFKHGTRIPIAILQRMGAERGDVRRLWTFTQRITLRARYPFEAVGESIARERLPINLVGFLESELRRLLRKAAV